MEKLLRKRITEVRTSGTTRSKRLRQVEPTEDQINRGFVAYVEKKHRKLAKHLIHIPNEGKRSLVEGARQKKLGLKKGVSDLFYAKPHIKDIDGIRHILCGLWFEIKTKTGRVTKEQNEFIELMNASHYKAYVIRSIDEAIQKFEEYVS